jgi:membrane-bound lytic murein transglycosylase B
MRAATFAVSLLAAVISAAPSAWALECSDTSAGFGEWKAAFAETVTDQVGPKGLQALASTTYATATIKADRGQKSFKLSLEDFMTKRGSTTIVARGKKLKAANAALFSSIQKKWGVPPGPLIAIWGMESAFGAASGKQNTLSAVATLAFDCRRSDYFREHLIAALQLVDHGMLTAKSFGAMHGEVGQTQFLPKNILLFGADGDGNGAIDLNTKADALHSTAKFLKGHGWKTGQGYQPGEPNFVAIEGWNAAGVYQQAIAIMGRQIDGG